MQWQGNPRNLPIRDGSISLNWSALGKWDPRSKMGLVWKFQLEPGWIWGTATQSP